MLFIRFLGAHFTNLIYVPHYTQIPNGSAYKCGISSLLMHGKSQQWVYIQEWIDFKALANNSFIKLVYCHNLPKLATTH